MYGLRTGAAICVSSSKDVADEFSCVLESSNRSTWSNGTRCGMTLLSTIMKDKELLTRVDEEREELRLMLVKRAGIFLEEAEAAGLETCPYKSGFFITIPAAQPEESCMLLRKENIFAVPISRGIRFAICSVPSGKLEGIAEKIKRAVESCNRANNTI
jgi:aromatic-amino-acid transaminase